MRLAERLTTLRDWCNVCAWLVKDQTAMPKLRTVVIHADAGYDRGAPTIVLL